MGRVTEMNEGQPTKFYLEYLEKEMTIMGLLSTFCVAVVALVLEKVLGAKASENMFLADIGQHGRWPLMVASAWMIFAAFYFYRQRSRLAWLYGQIALSLSKNPLETKDWLMEADAWTTWLHYHAAFAFMVLGFLYYAAAVWSASAANVATWISIHYILSFGLPALIALAVLLFRRFVLHKYPQEDEPFKKIFFSWWRP